MQYWDACTPLAVMGGSSKPLLIRCESNETNDVGIFVVKTVTNPTMLETVLYREALGIQLARYFGVPTPAPGLINLTSGFVQAALRNSIVQKAGLILRPGVGFGTHHFGSGYGEVDFTRRWEDSTYEQATVIYGLDLLTQNGDRKDIKPNCAQRDSELIAYDYGLTFSMLNFGALRINEFSCGPNHLFFNRLRNRHLDWAEFEHKLSSLTASTLTDMTKTFPQTWLAEQDPIFNFLLDAAQNSRAFVRVLGESFQ